LDENGNPIGIGEISTEQYLCDRDGNVLLHNNTDSYADNGDHFWNLMIQTTSGYDKEDLVQVCVIDFGDERAVQAFKIQYESDQRQYDEDTEEHHRFIIENVEGSSTAVRLIYDE